MRGTQHPAQNACHLLMQWAVSHWQQMRAAELSELRLAMAVTSQRLQLQCSPAPAAAAAAAAVWLRHLLLLVAALLKL